MDFFINQLETQPFITLFLTLGFGYLLGKFKIGKFELGGVAGSLIAAVVIGQVGEINIDGAVKSIFFALFIFMVGYNGGPQFFASFNKASIGKLFAAFMMCFTGLIVVYVCAKWAGLDMGLAAGLAAGGLTQSSIIGTAGNAIDQLHLTAEQASLLKTNVAVGYSITYIFGSLGPILMVSIIPMVCGWDLRLEASKLAAKLGGGSKQLKEDEFNAFSRVTSRAYKVINGSPLLEKNVADLEQYIPKGIKIEGISALENGISIEKVLDNTTIVKENDIVFFSGLTREFAKIPSSISGCEVGDFTDALNVVEVKHTVVLTNKSYANKTIKIIHEQFSKNVNPGVYLTQIVRMGHKVDVHENTELHLGDELTIVGAKGDLQKIEDSIGYRSPLPSFTDFTVFSFGMVLGFLIGELGFTIGGTHIGLGSGLGCLVSGLLVGYLRMRTPKFGSVNSGAANFMQTFGLAVFVAIVGLNAGKPALEAIEQHGSTLFLLGIVVTLLPQVLIVAFNYFVLRIKNPVEAMAVMVGSRSANPGFAALLDKTENSTPVASFTICYAVANIFLTLWGPIIIAMMS
ncbi:Aspartate/alanine antiporter [Vibrio mediterranei]|uniref:aspartate-alanine antiporter n=1 Tax=Vibrio mediterranei TaxID=689 RepID=UPI000784D499|nr:aspartate-alanine antiporter [Vibrio mediterranei]SBO12938.1 Aspartate/alanine antiporter [Vibrio mediterranei]